MLKFNQWAFTGFNQQIEWYMYDLYEQHKMYSGQPEVVVQNYIPFAIT